MIYRYYIVHHTEVYGRDNRFMPAQSWHYIVKTKNVYKVGEPALPLMLERYGKEAWEGNNYGKDCLDEDGYIYHFIYDVGGDQFATLKAKITVHKQTGKPEYELWKTLLKDGFVTENKAKDWWLGLSPEHRLYTY